MSKRAVGRSAWLAALLLVAGAVLSAAPRFESHIDPAAIARAIALGRSPEAGALERFDAPYITPLGGPLLDRIEVLTEFRRVVLATRDRMQFGDATTWGAREAAAMLAPYRGTVALTLRVTFPPQNTYRVMPRFEIVLYGRPGDAATRIEPIARLQTPRYVAGQPAPPGSPILGGSVEAIFRARDVNARGVVLAAIFQDGRELRRVEIDFGRLE